jgi:hypothetical protein
MGCPCEGGSANPQVGSVSFSDKVFLAPGETADCFMARSGDGGDADGSGEEVLDRIKNTAIQVKCDLSVDTTFELTKNSLSQAEKDPDLDLNIPNPIDPNWTAPAPWAILIKDQDDNVVDLSSIGLSFDSDSGKLSGTIKDEFEGKEFDVFITVTATHITNNNTVERVDERAYKMIGKKCDDEDLSFINPLPGSVVTSEYSLSRTITVNGITTTRPHKGIDLAYTGGKVGDVVAAADGEIVFAGWQRGYGNCITIKHSDSSGNIMAQTHYAHLQIIYISEGHVGAGTAIGREGNTGHSGGNHLHFEIRIGKPIDPRPYLFGSVKVDNSTSDSSVPSGNTVEQVNDGSVKLTTSEVKARSKCPDSVPIGNDQAFPAGKAPTGKQAFHKNKCRPDGPEGKPSKDDVIAKINMALDRHPELDANDRQYFITLTEIESSYDPYAWAGSTSALGPYQMVDGTAKAYFSKAGIPFTCENRCDPNKATEAMILMYKDQEAAYNKYKANGTINGHLPVVNEQTARYSSLSKGAWIYGLAHHDGLGNAASGKNQQGIDYWNTHSPMA